MRKILFTSATLGLLASSALAGDMSVSVTGRNFTEVGAVFGVTSAYKNLPASVGSGSFPPLNVTPNQKTYGLFNATRIGVKAQIEADNGMKYGAVTSLATTASRDSHPRDNRTYIFAEGNFGRFEAGSNVSVSRSMALGASTIAAASGGASDGNWSNYVRLGIDYNAGIALIASNLNANGGAISGVNNSNNADYYLMMSEKTWINGLGNIEEIRKISYYSPKVNGFQFGLSFAPDGANTGNYTKEVDHVNGFVVSYGSDFDLKNIISAGMSYSMERDNMTFDIAAVGDVGSAVRSTDAIKFNNLRSYNIGTVLGFGKIKFAAGYGSNGKSIRAFNQKFENGSVRSSVDAKSRQFNLGVSCENGPMTSSVTYFNSLASNNLFRWPSNVTVLYSYAKVQALSLGAHYKVASGVIPYIEATYIKINPGPKSTYVSSTIGTMGTRGNYRATVLLSGIAINF